MDLKKCVIAIPIYKNIPSKTEIASFRQGLSVLKAWDIVIFTHEGVDLSAYKKVAKQEGVAYRVECFDSQYFLSVAGYNRLCLTADFYQRFALYEYMLIYQLDAWVFKDELEYWCNKRYDYIGAPIFLQKKDMEFSYIVLGIGNGGFSLRKIGYCLDKLSFQNGYLPILTPMGIAKVYANDYKCLSRPKDILRFCLLTPWKFFLKCLGVSNCMNHYRHRGNELNEDCFFGFYAMDSWGTRPKLPSYQEAILFSFEVHPQKLFNETDGKLPFGCHAFEKYEYENFWKQHIII